MDEVQDFIKRRWLDTDAHWFDGNCYWFAKILTIRFPPLGIYYLPKVGHFIAGDGQNFYDCSGKAILDEKPVALEQIALQDSLQYDRLVHDCII